VPAALSAVIADLERMRDCFNFTLNGLADLAAEAAAAGIFETMEAEVGSDGAPWPELTEEYADWKARHFPGEKMSELHLKMKDPGQLKGELDVSPARMVQTYGTDDEARSEAVWFSRLRPFYGFSPFAVRLLDEVYDRRFEA
jgi:hypothetical protein